MIRRAETLTMTVVVMAVCCGSALGQATAATIYIELQNVVEYVVDTSDFSKFGTDPNVTPSKLYKPGCYGAGIPIIGYGDIVSVNGQPARGTYAPRSDGLHEPNSRSGRERDR